MENTIGNDLVMVLIAFIYSCFPCNNKTNVQKNRPVGTIFPYYFHLA